MTVNLAPDRVGPMHRNRPMHTDASRGYHRVPPTQRLADPNQCVAAESGPAGISAATDNKKFYETVISKSAATELRTPKSDGTSQSYRYTALPLAL